MTTTPQFFRQDMKLSLDIFLYLWIQYAVSKTPFKKEEHIEVLLQKVETQIAQARREWAEEMKKKCLEVIPEKVLYDAELWYQIHDAINSWLRIARNSISYL